MLPRPALTFALAIFLCSSAARAQTGPPPEVGSADQVAQYDTPAYVATVEGTATLEREGRVESSPLNMPLLSGDRLKTTAGRVEVRFADGGRLFLDNRTTLDVMSDALVRLVDGRVRITEVRTQQVNYRVDSTAGSARLLQPGDYRVALLRNDSETQLELAVIRGSAEIFTDQGTTPVQAGERAYASAGLLPSYASAYNSASMDEFDRWSEMQRGTVYAGADSASSQYLPQDMGGYASTFDQYGDWRYQQDYGYVWYPRVANDWRPYYYGRWASYPSYGWTWITADPFGYPTHHYGRWGVSAGVWFWVPSHHWGPAYVSWGYAPNYVSWCPLGFNNHAVFSLDLYNVGPAYYAGHYNGHYYSAWTTVPHGYFGHGYVHQHAVNFDRGYTGARPHFSQSSGPARGIAVQRRSTDADGVPGPVDGRGTATPVRFAGTRTGPAAPVSASPSAAATRNGEAVARGRAEAPRFVNRGNDIVRSQTAPAVAPRDNAVSRATPGAQAGSSAAQRQRYAWDNPAYRPPAAGDPNGVAPRGIDRAVPRTEAPSAPAYAPNYGAGRSYTRPNMDTPRAPSGAAVPNQMSQPQRPAYQPPSSGRGYGPAPSRAEGPAPSRAEGPAPSRVEGAGRPSGGSERAAPAAPRAGSGNGGGDHAVPRTGGGAPAQAAPSRGESRGGSQPRGGRGR